MSDFAEEFIINTPNTLAQKYWITNGADHAKHVVVFVQLIVGDTNHGIHGILVRIRDDDLKVSILFDTRIIFCKTIHCLFLCLHIFWLHIYLLILIYPVKSRSLFLYPVPSL